MKLKFRADSKDIAIFIVFCFVLLYFVAIAILNLVSFAQNGTLWGINPVPAFSAEYLKPTLIFFLLALIMIMTSVSNYFFERDKGFGISTDKKDKGGYSRWAKDKEMKKELKLVYPTSESTTNAGITLLNNGKELWVDDGENHNLVIGSTGSGKTQLIVLPLVKILAKKGESMIITDPKGEIYRANAQMLRDKGYAVMVLNFRDPDQGSAWNPLTLPYTLYKSGNKDKAIELLDDLAINILYDEKAQNQDPFWEKTSADYFVGLALALFEDAKESEVNLNSINLMSTIGEEKYRAKTYLHEYFSDKDPGSPMYVNVASALMAPADTKSSILSVFKQKIKLFSSREKISEMLAHNDIDMKSIGKQKTAVFIVVQDEKRTYHSLVTNFIKQAYETLIDAAQENGGTLKFRTNFVLDEFANMPPLKDVTTMVTAARSRKMRFTFIIQNFAQLTQVYGKENGDTIKGNCGNIVYLISSELSALEEISKMAGEVKSKEKEKTASTPLITVSDLQRLKFKEAVILRTRSMPFKTKLTPDFEMNWGKKYPVADFVIREMKPVDVFNVKNFVDNKNANKSNDLFGTSSNKPFVPPMFDVGMTKGNSSDHPLDVDDLVKRIDARIAELEEEERQEKIKSEKVTPMVETTITEPVIKEVEEPVIKVVEEDKPVAMIEEEVVGTPVSELIANKTTIAKKERVTKKEEVPTTKEVAVTDDQFFDDFFSDDEE